VNLSDLKDLDLDVNNAGNWPWPVKGVAIAVVAAVVLFAGYWFDLSTQWADLQQARQKETSIKQVFGFKQRKAANLKAYEKQLTEMRKSFGTMLRQLPSKTEVPELLVDISQTGLASGLEFRLFKPKAEIRKDFYAELPIRIEVTGTYHQFGKFVSGVAALSRIVTLHNISIKPQSKGDKLVMDLTAKTYRYLEAGGGGR
jgi:type IV pilus assembly protein PilO